MITDETFMKCGELHYVYPHNYQDGNSTKCRDCRYFVEDGKQKKKSPYYYRGECHSKASEEDRTHIFVRRIHSIDTACRWWFPIGPVAGEQEELIREEK